MNSLIQDFRHACRALLRTPGFTAGIVVTLALGIGVNATMFGVVDTLFLKPPSGVREPGGIVRVYMRRTVGIMGTFPGASTTYPSFEDLRDNVPAFAQAAGVWTGSMSLGRGAGATQLLVAAVSHQYFPMLGVTPSLGRFFGPEEDRGGGERVAVLSAAFWQSGFASDPSVLGSTLELGGGSYTVIGIGPDGFSGHDLTPFDVFIPIAASVPDVHPDPSVLTNRRTYWMRVIARLQPGVTREQAITQATLVYRRGTASASPGDSTAQVVLGPIQAARGPTASSDAKVSAWIGGVALIVLLIACANVANLLLARGVSRRHELAIRAGMGAGRARLVRLLLTESCVLALLGGAAALVLAIWASGAVRAFLLPAAAASAAAVDARVLVFTAGAVLLTILVAGVVPALHGSHTTLADALKSGGRTATERGGRTRAALLVAQVALTLVLLVGAGLFVRSLRNAQAIDLGFDAKEVLSASVDLTGISREEAGATYLRLLDQLQRLPAVEHAAAAMGTPFGYSYATDLRVDGGDSVPELRTGGPYYVAVTPDYFATLGTRVLRGRGIVASDVKGSGNVAVVSATFARLVWPGRDPLGRCLYIGGASDCTRVVGVAADAKRNSITETETLLYYRALAQVERPWINALFVRPRTGANDFAATIRRELQAVGNLPFARIRFLADEVAPQLRAWRLGAAAFTAFGLLALLISATGVFAVLSYAVSQRTHEIGIRIALGARAAQVVGMIVRQGMRATVAGLLLGSAGAYALGRAIASLLYGVEPTDPATVVLVVTVLVAAALVAAWLPARRAARVDPMVALRYE